ncbi:MAG: TIGR03032 family protein, partial [Hyphomicrobium sp.]|nr:TIGR03032 family protein [Hyphomicrobium sp.]
MPSDAPAAETAPVAEAKPAPPAPAQPAKPQPVNISCTRGLADWLLRNNVSLALTSYQTGRLYLVGVDDNKRVSFHERFLARAMGLWADPQRLVLSTLFQVWRFENVLAGEHKGTGPDRHFVPRVAHTTGDLDIHDISVMGDGRILFVNSLFSCLATLSPTHAFRMFWKPPFISKLAAEDRCHLNGLAMKDGQPAYVTATSRSDVVNGWRNRRAEGGCVIDVTSDEIVTAKLSMPHSPRWFNDRLWVLNSGTGHLGTVDLDSGTFEPR